MRAALAISGALTFVLLASASTAGDSHGRLVGEVVTLFEPERTLEVKIEEVVGSTESLATGQVVLVDVRSSRMFDEQGRPLDRARHSAWYVIDDGWKRVRLGRKIEVVLGCEEVLPAPRDMELPHGETVRAWTAEAVRFLP
jgi:hypothetical protein